MVTSHGSSSLSSQLVNLTRGDSVIDTGINFTSYQENVTAVTAKPIAKFLKSRSNLIQVKSFHPSIALHYVHILSLVAQRNTIPMIYIYI